MNPAELIDYYRRWAIMVEFSRGPLAIGAPTLPPDRHDTVRNGERVLHVLMPTDALCNRLTSYYAWNDYSGRATAVAIAATHPNAVDLNQVREWTLNEYRNVHMDQHEKFNEFIAV